MRTRARAHRQSYRVGELDAANGYVVSDYTQRAVNLQRADTSGKFNVQREYSFAKVSGLLLSWRSFAFLFRATPSTMKIFLPDCP